MHCNSAVVDSRALWSEIPGGFWGHWGKGTAYRQTLPADSLWGPSDASQSQEGLPFPGGDPKAATVTADSWVPRGLAGGQSCPSLTWQGNDALRGFLAFSLPLLLFSNWFLTFLKDNSSHITLLPKTLQSHLEKCKPRESGDGVFPVHQVPGAQHSSRTHRIRAVKGRHSHIPFKVDHI